jgi:hypothetical protein
LDTNATPTLKGGLIATLHVDASQQLTGIMMAKLGTMDLITVVNN